MSKILIDRAAMQQALEALEAMQGGCTDHDDGTVEAITVWCPEIITALKAALAEPVQEPVAWMSQGGRRHAQMFSMRETERCKLAK